MEAVNESRPYRVGESDTIRLINELDSRVARRYGNRRVTSLASKVAWFALDSSIVICDSLARDALGVRTNDYGTFYHLWHKQYAANHDAIARATLRYSREQWFCERAFDTLLWRVGDARRTARRKSAKNAAPLR